jgi:hypothetical protein
VLYEKHLLTATVWLVINKKLMWLTSFIAVCSRITIIISIVIILYNTCVLFLHCKSLTSNRPVRITNISYSLTDPYNNWRQEQPFIILCKSLLPVTPEFWSQSKCCVGLLVISLALRYLCYSLSLFSCQTVLFLKFILEILLLIRKCWDGDANR